MDNSLFFTLSFCIKYFNIKTLSEFNEFLILKNVETTNKFGRARFIICMSDNRVVIHKIVSYTDIYIKTESNYIKRTDSYILVAKYSKKQLIDNLVSIIYLMLGLALFYVSPEYSSILLLANKFVRLNITVLQYFLVFLIIIEFLCSNNIYISICLILFLLSFF